MIRSIAISTAILFAASPVFAQEFLAKQTIEKMIQTPAEDGSVSVEFVPADRVQPGEPLLYTINYENQTATPAENVALVMAVPEEVTYTENSASTGEATVSFSTDNGQSFAPRGELVVTADGAPRSAESEDITHIRWAFQGAVAPGATGQVAYRAVVR